MIEKLYKRNEIARGEFVALGEPIDLGKLRVPLFLLAARDDELVAPAQLFATEHLVGTPPRAIDKALAPCNHGGLVHGTDDPRRLLAADRALADRARRAQSRAGGVRR